MKIRKDAGNGSQDNYSKIEHYLHLYNLSSFWNNSVGIYRWNDLSNDNQKFGGTAIMGFVCEWEPLIPVDAVYYNGHAYKVYDLSMTWNEAKMYAETLGGHLATITSENENVFVSNLIQSGSKYCYWIGGTDEQSEGIWNWITGENWSYINWLPNQPDNCSGLDGEEEDYLALERQKKGWNDLQNRGDTTGSSYIENIGFLCEWE